MAETKRTSRIPGCHRLDPGGRLEALLAAGWLEESERQALARLAPDSLLDRLSENVVARFELPLSVVTNVVVNGRPRLIPLVTEEASVVAGCCKAALLALAGGGVEAAAGSRQVGAQLLVETRTSPGEANRLLPRLKRQLSEAMARSHPALTAAGGRVVRLSCRPLHIGRSELLRFTLVLAVADAMGAAVASEAAEELGRLAAPALAGSRVAAIVTNRACGPVAGAWLRLPVDGLATADVDGPEVARRIELLSRWAQLDGARKVTHVKGVLNGIIGLLTALGQDCRAAAAALTDYAAVRKARTVATWQCIGNELVGSFQGPVVCGTAGGAGAHLPLTRLLLGWLGVSRATELEEVAAAVGLLQSLAALHAIAGEGIHRGHQALHQRKRLA